MCHIATFKNLFLFKTFLVLVPINLNLILVKAIYAFLRGKKVDTYIFTFFIFQKVGNLGQESEPERSRNTTWNNILKLDPCMIPYVCRYFRLRNTQQCHQMFGIYLNELESIPLSFDDHVVPGNIKYFHLKCRNI